MPANTMKPLIITPTDSTPKVTFDFQANKFEFSGESRPENTKTFYEPLLNWVKELSNVISDPKKIKPIVVKVQLEYFSSTSAKYIANLLAQFETIIKKGCKVEVLWRYRPEDAQIKDAGEQFQKILSIPFVFEKYED